MVAAKREVVIPEGLEGIEHLSASQRQKLVDEYVAKQRQKFEDRLTKRAERYESKLVDKASTDGEIIRRRVLIQMATTEIQEKRATVKQLRDEIKAMKAEARKGRKGSVKKAAQKS